ncbi:seminal ribonuclease-like [Antechinus flavipes]|uniref:seminal ribonuclease-like n=1 Tax=Antechinus flavipes TaxID=38775 RepID=UPI002235A289|nr:seminal ribonuclease-like [Antechinus flavipes]
MSYAVMFLLLLLDLIKFSYAQTFWTLLHIDYPKSDAPGSSNQYCNVMIGWRKVPMFGACKPVHTFIHENTTSIANLCSIPPKPCGKSQVQLCHESPSPINVTDCFAKSGFRPPTCQYLENSESRKIQVICKDGQPIFLKNKLILPQVENSTQT